MQRSLAACSTEVCRKRMVTVEKGLRIKVKYVSKNPTGWITVGEQQTQQNNNKVAGILRSFRQDGQGSHNQLLMFTSGLMEEPPPTPLSGSVLSSRNSLYLRNPKSLTSEKWDTSFEIYDHQQHIKPSLKSTIWHGDSQLCVYVVNKLGCDKNQQ